MKNREEIFLDLVRTQGKFITLLQTEIASSAGLLYVHGWRCPSERVKEGKELREKIDALKKELATHEAQS